jgi:hypothetical protein
MFVRALFVFAAVVTGSAIGLAPIASAAPYANCTQAKSDGVCSIPQGSSNYQAKLDRDGDGIGCEC